MRLVIDTNRVIAGLVKPSVSRFIILSEAFNFYAPDQLFSELMKYREYLLRKSHLARSEFDVLMARLTSGISILPFEQFQKDYMRAFEIMRSIDEKDTAFIAVGMRIQAEGVWTEDKHFLRQNVLPVFSTKDLLARITSE